MTASSTIAEAAGARAPARPQRDTVLAVALLALLAAAYPAAAATGQGFWTDVLARAMILAIAATSLNLLVGLGGLVSMGHAAFLGIGAYTVGIAADLGLTGGPAQLAIAVAASALFALATGAVALRTRGVHFIMITLAFGQMLYFVLVGLRQYGGDDGLTINEASAFPGLDLGQRPTLYYVVLGVLALTLVLFARLRRSRFGLVLRSVKGNERRVRATGFNPYSYRLAAYVGAGVVAGLAGFLQANFTSFVTPGMMGWENSGELLFMVILGGTGTLSGPLLGAAVFLLFEEAVGSLTVYWQFWFGILLVLAVLFGRGGIVGLIERRR